MKRKVIITLPKGQSGLEVKMKHLRAGLGMNSNVMPWPIMAGKMSEPAMRVNSTLPPVPRDEANLEAEKGEIAAIPTKSGIPDTYKIGGKRHYEGGTPLNLPTDSFIFSDTPKMRIKDKVVLAQFGMPERKSGYTPAEIAKKYDLAPFKKILLDKTTDKMQKKTAEIMIANYNLKLAKLALVQESMKGFPQGIPAVAMPYIQSMQIDPAEFVQMNPGQGDAGAQQEEAGSTMAYGGDVDYFDEGGPNRRDYKTAPTLTPEQMAFSKANLYPAFNQIYDKMLNNTATDQIDETGSGGADMELQDQLRIAHTASSGKSLDPGTYAKNLNNVFGENVIAFPAQPAAIVENWDNGQYRSEPQPSIDEANKNISDRLIKKRYLKDFNVLNPQKDFEAEKRDQYYATQEIAYGGTIDYFDNGGYKSEAEYKAHLLDPYSPEKKQAQLDWLTSRNLMGVASQFIPGYETYSDIKNMFQGAATSDKELLNSGIIGLAAPFAGKAVSNIIDYATEKGLGKDVANTNAAKRNDIVNMTTADLQKMYTKYGPGGYDKWAKEGFPKLAYGGMPRYANGGGITPEQAKVMMQKALATNDPAVMKQTAANIAAMKDSGALSWAWNPLADEWDFDKYEDLLNDKAEQVANYNKGQENYTAYKNKFFGQVLPEYEKAYKQFQANPLAATNVDMKKMKDVMKLKNQLGAYELAIQADKQGKPPPIPVSGDMLMGNPSTVFDPALLNSYVPTKEAALLKETKTENVSANDAAAAEAAARLAKGQPAEATAGYDDVTDMNLTKAEIDKYKAAGEKFIINGVKYN